MNESQATTIAAPPTIYDILSTEQRIGQVDFSAVLAPEPEPEPEAVLAQRDAAAAKPMIHGTSSATGEDDAEAATRLGAFVLPVATLTGLRTPVAVAVAVADEPVLARPAVDQAEEPAYAVAVPEPVDHSDEQAHFDARLAAAERLRADEQAADQQDTRAEPTTITAPEPALLTEALPPDDELTSLVLSIEQVAESVITRMRAAAEASLRHLESVEDEAAQRCELLTAQAELDAELIRLQARREAHAIITAARIRAGGGTSSSPDSQHLDEISETFSRFVDSIETTVPDLTRFRDLPSTP